MRSYIGPCVLRVISTAFSIVWCRAAPLDHPLPACSPGRNGTLNMFRFIGHRTKRQVGICFRKVGFTNVFTLFYTRARAQTHTHTHKHIHTCAQSSAWHEYFSYRNFRGACCLRFYGLMSTTINQSTRRHSPENFNLYQHVCESLKSRTDINDSFVFLGLRNNAISRVHFVQQKICCVISKRLKYSERSYYTLGYAICVGWELRDGPIALRIADVQTKIPTGYH